MPYAQYDKVTGAIAGTNSQQVSDEALAELGRAQASVDEGIDGDKYKINLDTLQPELIEPPAQDAGAANG